MSETITENYNGIQLQQYTKKQKEFLKKAIDINLNGDLFCCDDYTMSKTNFRQKIHELREIIECIVPGRPCYYHLKDIEYTGKKYDHITLRGMEVGKKMQRQLESLYKQPPAIHDIKLTFQCSELYNYFVNTRKQINPHNKGISYPMIRLNDHMVARVTVYPKTTVVDIGCTYKPIIYDPRGSLELVRILEKVRTGLELDGDAIVKTIPNPLDWTITQYHFNRDSAEEFSGPRFHITVDEFAVGFVRHYSKRFQDGKTRIRSEKIVSPNRIVKEEIEQMKAK